MTSSAIKKIAYALLCALFAAACVLSACAPPEEPVSGGETRTVRVSMVDSMYFTAENTAVEVEYGGDAVFNLTMRGGYRFSSCSYPDYEVAEEGTSCTLTVKNIKEPTRVTISATNLGQPVNINPTFHCAINYVINDGTYDERKVGYTLSYHIRPNTLSGEGIECEGYTLIGWNTAADGSGEHIGLGSRVTVAPDRTLTLYGEWVKWMDEDDFVSSRQPDGTVHITGYRGEGDVQPFVVPGQIDGLYVSEITSAFTTNMKCGELTAKTLVLPSALQTVDDNSFVNSSFSEIYFFDSLEYFGPDAFSNAPATYHVNANTPPRLQAVNYNVRFADNLDRIIVNADRPKLILYSGCSLAYGVNSSVLNAMFGGKYVVVNAGLNGEFNALFQMECMLPYIREGDVFVHAPEQMNPYQFLKSYKVDSRVFCMVEGNYDLLALADFSYTDRMTEAYTAYASLREEEEECDYSDYTGVFNNYGDHVEERPYDEATDASRDVAYSQGWGYDMNLLEEQNIADLAAIYQRLSDRGAAVYFSWAPMNEQSDANEDIYAAAEQFEERLEELFAPYGIDMISEVTDYIWKGRYFYDTDYHLNDMGALLRTEQLAADIQAALLRDGKGGGGWRA